YECLRMTQVVKFGVPADAAFSGQAQLPAEGARFDNYFEGAVTGKFKGTLKGVDYLHIRADGRSQLNVHAETTTEDGTKIAFAADGLAIPEPGSLVLQIRESVSLMSHHPEYSWLNRIHVWATGTVNLATGEVQVSGYQA